MKYASFYVGENLFGIPIFLVQEISRPTAIYEIPGHDKRIEGLVNLRGRTAVAINMHQCIYGTPSTGAPGLRKKLIILETADGLPQEAIRMGIQSFDEPLILVVDDVYKITSGEKEQYYNTPAHINDAYVEGVIKVDDHLMTLISIPRLVDNIQLIPEETCDEKRV